MDGLILLAVGAGILQAVGYGLYLKSPYIEPEPTTWLMWGSTTWIIAAIEAHVMIRQGETHVELLALPVICGFMAGIVAYRCYRRGTIRWPEEWLDRAAFVIGMGATFLVYLPGFAAVEYAWISHETHGFVAIAVLITLNVITVVEFSPLLRNTWRNPDDERPGPWMIWGVAYSTLFAATLWETGWSSLLVYPGLNAVLHGSIGLLALPARRARRSQMPAE